jgi:hypothetical protein
VARCPECLEIIPVGCNCEVLTTDCFVWDGDGSVDDPYTLSPDLDPSVNNLLTCGGSGLLAKVPAVISNPPACSAFRSTNQSISNNTLTAVSFANELYDTDTMHSNTVNPTRVTFTTAGTYVVTFVAVWNKNAVGNRVAEIRKNGTDVLAYESKLHGGADLFVGHSLVVQDEFVATDYVEGLVLQTSGGALLLLSEYGSPILSAVYA